MKCTTSSSKKSQYGISPSKKNIAEALAKIKNMKGLVFLFSDKHKTFKHLGSK